MAGPLDGIRVLDLSRILAGPWSMQTLGDMGADILKIERPGAGDDSRQWGPPWLSDNEGRATGESSYFLSANRNKRSVAIDINTGEGADLVRQLAGGCDIFIENYKVGGLARYGLDYAAIRAVRPDIVYCSLTAFGQDGPFADRPGYDYLFQGLGGLMSVTGERDGRPGAGPQRLGLPLVDLFTGMYASVAILGALHHRTRTGEGQHIDLSLFDTVMAMSAPLISNYFLSGKVPGRIGNASANITPYEVFPCADGQMIIASANQSQYAALCKVLGHPEWISDPRFVNNAARMQHHDTLFELLSSVLVTRTRLQWEEVLHEVGVPAGPINDYAQALQHPQAAHHATRVEVDHALGVKAPGVASPLRFSRTPVQYRHAPPMLGAHTREVLREQLGLSDPAIDALAARKIVAT